MTGIITITKFLIVVSSEWKCESVSPFIKTREQNLAFLLSVESSVSVSKRFSIYFCTWSK
jgi:capsule polysaccharide export protein KpsC/LpsZ